MTAPETRSARKRRLSRLVEDWRPWLEAHGIFAPAQRRHRKARGMTLHTPTTSRART